MKEKYRTKVLFIIPTKAVNNQKVITGPERRMINMLPYWKKTNVLPVYAYPREGILFDSFSKSEFDTVEFRTKNIFDIKAIIVLRNIIKTKKIDIVFTHGGAGLDLIASIAAFFSKVPHIVSRPVLIEDQVHYSRWKKFVYNQIDSYFTLRLANQVVTVSKKALKNMQHKLSGVYKDKVNLIYNGVKINKKAFPKNLQPDKPIRITMIGHLSIVKGWFDFIEICRSLKEEKINYVANIVGEGELKKVIEQKIKDYNLKDNIVLKGHVSDIYELLNNTDLFLFTSKREGMSVAVLEALHSALPIVASDVGGINEQVFNNVNGFVIKSGELNLFVEAIKKIIFNPKIYHSFSAESLTIARKNFLEEKMVKDYEQIIQKVVLNEK